MTFLRVSTLWLMISAGSASAQVVPPAGTWAELPNTRLNVQNPALPQVQFTYTDPQGKKHYLNEKFGGNANPDGLGAYSGFSLDRIRRQVRYLRSGGHGDYPGYEGYRFDLDASAWHLEYPPDLSLIPMLNTVSPAFYTDAKGREWPAAAHTYFGSGIHMLAIDKFWLAGGARWSDASPTNETWHYDGVAKRYERQVLDPLPGGSLGILAAHDDATGRVIVHNNSSLIAYDPRKPAGTRYKQLSPNEGWLPGSLACLLDQRRRRFLLLPHMYPGPGWSLYTYDLTKPDGQMASVGRLDATMTGNVPPLSGLESPLFFHDTTIDRYVVHHVALGANVLYLMHPDMFHWTKVTGGGDPVPPRRIGWGRMFHDPVTNLYFRFGPPSQNVMVFNPAGVIASPSPSPMPTQPSRPR